MCGCLAAPIGDKTMVAWAPPQVRPDMPQVSRSLVFRDFQRHCGKTVLMVSERFSEKQKDLPNICEPGLDDGLARIIEARTPWWPGTRPSQTITHPQRTFIGGFRWIGAPYRAPPHIIPELLLWM